MAQAVLLVSGHHNGGYMTECALMRLGDVEHPKT